MEGAAGFGPFGTDAATLTIVAASSSVDFAVGEFGVAAVTAVAAVPEPSTPISGGIAGSFGLGYALRSRRRPPEAP